MNIKIKSIVITNYSWLVWFFEKIFLEVILGGNGVVKLTFGRNDATLTKGESRHDR